MADGALHFVVTQDNKQMLASLEQMRQGFSRMSQQAEQSGNELDQTLNRLKSTLVGVAGGVASVATLKELGKQVMNVRGEFQQLEIAFGTMLGDGEKANKLMSQLINTAAKTPFDLKGIAQGAKQLLAYGISADDVNDTLVRLGDIAAGLSVPLNDLVYLYGTTMVQGRMFTQDLRQFQGRGVPLMEALADTMGVAKDEVSDLVSTGKVGAAEFQKAILSLTDEGSKFGGLMDKQSKSITGQIGNIQDGIDMMFNEIGQKSEGFINKALSGVSNLVENYEKVGKAVLAVAGTYGTYRAALVVVSAVEKAHTAMLKAAVLEKTLAAGANITLSNSDAMAAARKAFFTKTIKLNTQALLKNTAAMLTNPAVLVTAGLVALCASVYTVSKALNTQARAQEQVNKLNSQNKEYLDQVKSDADQAIATIQSETATIYEKAKAYRTLQSIMPALTKQFSQEEIATMKLADAQKNVAATIEDMEFAQKANEITKSEKAISNYEQQLSELSKMPNSGASMMTVSNKLDTERKVLKQLKREYQDMLQLREQALFDAQSVDVKIAKFTTDKETLQKQLDDIQARADEAVAKAKEEWENNPLNKWRIDLGVTFEQAASESPSLLGGEYNLLQPVIKGLQNSIQETDNQIQSLSASTTTQTKQMLEEVNEETLKAENERQRILNSSIQAERVKREAAYWQTIREINQEEAAYRKANEGRTSKEFKIKRNNAELQLIIDTEALDRQFAEWKRNIEQETINLQYDFETSELERAINLEQDWNEKLAKQEALRNKIIEQIEEEARQTKETELGAHTDPQLYSTFLAYNAKGSTDEDKSNAISEYINAMSAKGIKVNTDSLITTLQEMSEKVVLIDQQTAEKVRQQRKTFENEDYDMLADMLTNYLTYEEQKQQLDNDYNIARTKAQNLQDEQLRARMLDAIEKDYQERSRSLAEVIKNELFGLDGTLSKKLSSGAIDGITKVIKSLRKLVKRESLNSEESSFVQSYLGLTDEKMQTLQSNADVVMSLLNELEDQTSSIQDFLGGSLSETVSNFFTQIGNDVQKGTKPLTAFKEKLSNLFSTDGIGQFAGVLSQVITQINQAMQAFAATSTDPATTQMAEVLGGIFQNFAAAGQGAATGGWIGAIVAGVTDAIGQLSSAIMNDMSVMSEYRGVANELELALLNLRYSRMLNANGNSIFGKNNRGELTAALTTLKYVNSEWDSFMGGLDQSSVKFDDLFDLLDKRGQSSTALTTIIAAIGSPEGIIGAAVALHKYNEALKEYKGTTLETLVGGFNTWNQDNLEQYLKAIENGYTSLEALQVKTKDYKLKKDEYASLKDLAPDVFNSDGTVNVDELDAFLSAYDDKLTSDQKLLLQKLRNNQNAYNESLEQALGYYEDLFGGVGSAIQDAFVDAFKNGEDALDNFTDSLESSVEQWIEDIAYAATIAPILQQANDYVENAVKDGSDTDAAVERAFDLIFGNLDSMYDDYSAYLNEAKSKYADNYGLNLFDDSDDTTGSSGGFQSMSQDTADELNARFTALQIEGANVVSSAQIMQTMLEDITNNDRLRLASIQNMASNVDIGVTIQQNILDQTRMIAEAVDSIKEDTVRLRTIEQNTDRL